MTSESAASSFSSPLRRLTGVRIVSTGAYVPATVVTNEDLRCRNGFDPEWIVQRTGVHERRFAAVDQSTSDLAVEAATRCLARAGVDPRQIDLLVVATCTPDHPIPSTACLVQERLGLNAPAMDLNAGCAGFMYSLITALQYVATGCSQLALVVGAEILSRVSNPADKCTYPIFGDGAGAVLVARGEADQGLLSYTLGSDGRGAPLIMTPMGGTRLPVSCPGIQDAQQYLRMDGRPVFKWAIRVLQETSRQVLQAAGVTKEEIRLFLVHQANTRIIDAFAEAMQIDRQKIVVNMHRYGNTSAASIPICLDEACAAGLIQRGDLVLLSGFGAGLVWGTGVLRW